MSRVTKCIPIGFLIVLICTLLFINFTPLGWAEGRQSADVEDNALHLFWREGCNYCSQMKIFLAELQKEYPDLEILSYDTTIPLNKEIWNKMAAKFGADPGYVPQVFYRDHFWGGYTIEIAEEIRAAVANEHWEQPAKSVTVPFIGKVELAEGALLLNTVIIAFVDGINPCSLWVLSLLLTMVLITRSRKRLLIVGLTFLTVTSLVYGLFIIGVFSVFDNFMAYERSIQYVVSVIAILFGLINIKDFFWFKKGVSLTISEKHKPTIYQKIRQLITEDKSFIAIIITTASLAAGVTLIELPCTSGFPVIWTNMLISQSVTSLTFGFLLFIYLLVFLIDELVLFILAAITLKASRLQETHGKILKLIGGTIMISLGMVLLLRPELMQDVEGSLFVFASAIAVAFLILGFWWTFTPEPNTITDDTVNKKE